MADFLLSVGVDPTLSYQEMERGIKDVVQRLNLNPPKIKLEFDKDAFATMRSQIEEINKSLREIGKLKLPTDNSPKQGAMKYGDAAKAVRDYYNAIKTYNKGGTDISFNDGVYSSASGNFSALASELNRTHNAIDMVTTAMNTMPMKDQIKLQSLLANESQKCADAIKKQADAVREASTSSKEPSMKQQLDNMVKATRLYEQMGKNLSKWTAAKTGKSKDSYLGYQETYERLGALFKETDPVKFAKGFEELKKNAEDYARVIKLSNEDHKSLLSRIGGLAKKFSEWFTLTRVIMAAWRTFKQMLSAVKELDTAMTELKKVTSEADATYEKFLDNASARAKKLGSTMSDIVTATADFARLGYSIADAEQLADAAIVYKNVGDGIDDINTASESIIATMQAFGLSAGDAMSVVDKFNAVGNNYAISSKGVGDALLRSAAAMQSANNTLDETIALAAAANTIVQDPDKVGTTLKTVAMYLRAAKTEAEEAGESTEGMANSASELRKELLSLTGGKVDIQLDENTFKSTYQILKELSGIWHELTDVSQANILEMVGGKRNANVVAAILENFDVANRAVETSSTSAGSALEENAKVLESIEGKMAIFKATFEDFSKNLIGSDLIKLFVDMGTGLLTFINGIVKVCDALGGLKSVLSIVTSVLLLTRTEWVLTTTSMIATRVFDVLTNGFSSIINVFTGFQQNLKRVQTAWHEYQATVVGSAEATAAAGALMKSTIPFIGLLITALTIGISAYNRAQEKALQKNVELANSYKEESSAISESISKYDELYESINNGILSAQEIISAKEELAKIEDSLVDKYGTEALNIDLVNGKYDEQIAKLKELSKEKATQYVADNFKGVQDDIKYLDKNISRAAGFDAANGLGFDRNIISKYSNLSLVEGGTGFILKTSGKREETREQLESLFDEIKKRYGSDSEQTKSVLNAISKLLNNEAFDASEIDATKDRIKQFAEADILSEDNTSALYYDAVNAVEQYNKAIASGDGIEDAMANLDSVKSEVEKAFGKNGILKNITGADEVFSDLWDNISKGSTKAIESFNDSRTSMISSLNGMSEGFEELDKIYTSIKDKDPFDFKLLDNKQFKDNFSGLDTYADFIEQVTSNPNDIKACQSAFNDLVTEWINTKGVLNNVTEENKNLTISMLKQMGVENAEEVVLHRLNAQKEASVAAGKSFTDITDKEIDRLIIEGKVSLETTQYLAQLRLAKLDINNVKLDTRSDIDNIIAIANAAGASVFQINALKTALSKLSPSAIKSKINIYDNPIKTQETLKQATDQVKDEIQGILNGVQKQAKLKASDYYASYTGGSKSNTDSGDSTEEKFNWIETAISRAQRAVTNFGKTVSATWKSWTERNKALKDQISAVTNEINVQNNAYQRYMQLANSVGLGEPYASLVRNGAMDISTITNEDLAKKISLYQEYYDAALEAYDAAIDAQNELSNLAQTQFDNIAKQYDDVISLNEHKTSMLESTADILENQGYMVGAGIYDALVQTEEKNLSDLEDKYKSLNNALNASGIEKYTEQWYAMKLEVLQVEEAIQDSRNKLVEYNNVLQELDWTVFDKIQEKISAITEEADFLISIMSDEKMFNDDGNITEHGQATLGLHALKFNTYMAQADEYAKELLQINEELANDPYNDKLIQRRDELLEQQRDMILSAEDEKQAMKDLMSEGYDALLSAMEKIISKRKEMLSQIKDLYDYEKSIAEQTADVSKYKKIIDSIQGMTDTEEGKAALQKYEVSLKEAEDNLEETQYEKYISDQEQILDSLYEQTEEWVNSRLDKLDGLIGQVIERTNANATDIQTTLKTEVEKVGTTLSGEMLKLWNTNGIFTNVVSSCSQGQIDKLGTLHNVLVEIKGYVSGLVDDAKKKATEEAAKATASTPSTTVNQQATQTTAPAPAPAPAPATAPSSGGGMDLNSIFISKNDSYPKNKLKTETSVVDRLKYFNKDSSFSARSKYYSAMGGSGAYTGSSKQNTWMISQMKANGFKHGGTIGGLIKASGEDGFILAKTGEEILSLEKIKALGESFALINPVVDKLSKLPVIHGIDGSHGFGDMHIDIGDIQMYGVNDPEAFAIQLKDSMLNNSSIRKIMKDTTIGEALGKNSMIRYTR